MLKACSYCGTIHSRSYICAPKQSAIAAGQRKRSNDKITHFRNSAEWKTARKAALERDMNICRICAEEQCLCGNDLQVHHIIPLVADFSKREDLSNLITLCRFHHEAAEAGLIPIEKLTELAKSKPK